MSDFILQTSYIIESPFPNKKIIDIKRVNKKKYLLTFENQKTSLLFKRIKVRRDIECIVSQNNRINRINMDYENYGNYGNYYKSGNIKYILRHETPGNKELEKILFKKKIKNNTKKSRNLSKIESKKITETIKILQKIENF